MNTDLVPFATIQDICHAREIYLAECQKLIDKIETVSVIMDDVGVHHSWPSHSPAARLSQWIGILGELSEQHGRKTLFSCR